MKKIKILIKEPHMDPYVLEVDDDLKAFQKIVGGYIECVEFPGLRNVDLFVNDEGKINKLENNFWLPEYEDCVVGTCYMVGYDPETCDNVSIKDKDIDYCKKYIKYFEIPFGLSVYEDYATIEPFMKKQYQQWKKIKNMFEEM